MRAMQDNQHTFEVQQDDQDEKDPLNQQEAAETVEAAPQIPMPYSGHTLEFPRKDNMYKKKEALPLDEADSLVWKRAFKNDWRENLKHWWVYIMGGIMVGICAFGMSKLEDLLVNSNRILLQYVIDVYTESMSLEILLPIISYCSIAAVLGLAAGLLTVYYGPGANGSGVAEMIGYMNGINYPEFIGINTLITKIMGVTLAVSSRLCIGKEGPLAHIGSNLGLLPAYLPIESVKTLQNDYTKRQLIAAGGSAGVAAAFGAPIGGALFAYEMSKPTSFWNFQMIWKTFITCAFAVLTLGILQTIASNQNVNDGFSGSTVKFGSITQSNQVNSYQNILGSIIIGVVGGLLGTFFVGVNFRVNVWRKNLLKSKWIKPIETAFWSVLTSFLFILVPYLMWYLSNGKICLDSSQLDAEQADRVYRGWCGDGKFDPNLSLFLSTEGDIIRNIMDQKIEVEYWNMFFFFLTWYLLTITTYGTFVPAGLFLPGMIIGCAMGDVLFKTMHKAELIAGDNDTIEAINKNYIVIGCAGFMAGYTRMTYSLAVIIMETANDIQIFLPIMITITISNFVAYFSTRSLYERAIRGKQMPLIRDWIPEPCQNLVAENVMSKQVVTLKNVCKLSDIKTAISTNHHAFPVINSKGNFVGILPRNFLLILLQERHFYGSNIDATFASDKQEYTSSSVMQAQAIKKGNEDKGRSSQGGFATLKYKLADNVQGSAEARKYFSTYFDIEVYPPTPDEKLLHWTKFTRDFWSVDLPVTSEHFQICEFNESAMIDVRPYLIETPMRVMTTDYLSKCVQYMRKFHMRHIPVLHPSDGKLRGIITRQDLFKWLDS